MGDHPIAPYKSASGPNAAHAVSLHKLAGVTLLSAQTVHWNFVTQKSSIFVVLVIIVDVFATVTKFRILPMTVY